MHRFKSVLVVDDQKTASMMASEVLKQLGFAEVGTAADGAEALLMLERRRYDLVVSDLHMPGMGGLELAREIRASIRFGSVPFILVSGDDGPDLVASAQEAGADAFLAKPFNGFALRRQMALLREMRDRTNPTWAA